MLRTMVYKRKEHANLQERHMRGIYAKPTLTELHSKNKALYQQCTRMSPSLTPVPTANSAQLHIVWEGHTEIS